MIRQAWPSYGVRRSGPAFYQLMARIERATLVEGWYEQAPVGDQAVTKRRYCITREGARLWADAHRFYDELARLPAKVRWSDAWEGRDRAQDRWSGRRRGRPSWE